MRIIPCALVDGREAGTRGRAVMLMLVWIGVCVAAPIHACAVPVYRYALERWSPDGYEVIIFRHGALTGERAALVARLRALSTDERLRANLSVREVDPAAGELPADLRATWKQIRSRPLPLLVVRTPAGEDLEPRLVLHAPLEAAAVSRVLDSPGRREVVRGLLAGSAAVWVLVDSGERKLDDAVAARIRRCLAKLRQEIDLPDPADGFAGPDAEGADAPAPVAAANREVPPPRHPEFRLVRVSRDDPAERFFIRMLMVCNPEVRKTRGKPLVFPVFGRGRVLRALSGEEITHDNIEEVCRFLSGPCSCRVKALNPGMDLLLSANWSAVIDGDLALDQVLPPLEGVALSRPRAPAPTLAGGMDLLPPGGGRDPGDRLLLEAAAAAVVAVLLAVLAGYLWLRRHRTD